MFCELIMCTRATGETCNKSGSLGYVPRSVDGLNILKRDSIKVVINFGWDPMKGNAPSGLVDVFFL